MEKSPEAFRTISEVADWLGVPTHVLRFWESRFNQIKPVKRAGGRRYYRPTDMALIGGIKRLLHDEGMTIRGAQKLLREKGVKHVAALSQPLDGAADISAPDVIDATAVEVASDSASTPDVEEIAPEPAPEPDPVQPEAEDDTPEDAVAVEEPAVDEGVVEPAVAATIPATPDVPDSDPDDADTAFPATASIAARLWMADREDLRRNRDALSVVKNRLETRVGA
ncbi:MAG: MerR family transcriptional regulator [Pseudomonadota bacterium]